jgi:hypothetical protein
MRSNHQLGHVGLFVAASALAGCQTSTPEDAAVPADTATPDCNTIDENCDGADCCEQDDDGYACQVDCDDTRQRIHPGATPSTECDYEDRDCDGAIDFLGCDF